MPDFLTPSITYSFPFSVFLYIYPNYFEGNGRVIVSATLDELDGVGHVKNPGAQDNILVLAIVEDIDESYANLCLIFELLGFPLRKGRRVKWVADLKLTLTVIGTFLF